MKDKPASKFIRHPLSLIPPSRLSMPLDLILWVPRDRLNPNDYNPNTMPPPEFELLKVSILEDGWTQPIVCTRSESFAVDGRLDIVDGFHRWTVADDPLVAALTSGLVPIVTIDGDRAHRMCATVRHNRARGEHGVIPMASLVRELLEHGVPPERIQVLLGMEDEEVERLAEKAGLPAVVSRTHTRFSRAWEPGEHGSTQGQTTTES